MYSYTVNVEGDKTKEAKLAGFHAYYANGVTAVEIQARNRKQARDIAVLNGWKVLYIFE